MKKLFILLVSACILLPACCCRKKEVECSTCEIIEKEHLVTTPVETETYVETTVSPTEDDRALMESGPELTTLEEQQKDQAETEQAEAETFPEDEEDPSEIVLVEDEETAKEEPSPEEAIEEEQK